MSWKEVTDKYGVEESRARVKSGSLKAKRDPEDKRFWLFMVNTEHGSDTFVHKKKASTKVENKISSRTASRLKDAMQHAGGLEDAEDLFDTEGEALHERSRGREREGIIMRERRVLRVSFATQASQARLSIKDVLNEDAEQDDEQDDEQDEMPGDLLELVEQGAKSKPKPTYEERKKEREEQKRKREEEKEAAAEQNKKKRVDEFNQKLDNMSQAAQDGKAVKVASQLHSILTKQVQAVRQMQLGAYSQSLRRLTSKTCEVRSARKGFEG